MGDECVTLSDGAGALSRTLEAAAWSRYGVNSVHRTEPMARNRLMTDKHPPHRRSTDDHTRDDGAMFRAVIRKIARDIRAAETIRRQA